MGHHIMGFYSFFCVENNFIAVVSLIWTMPFVLLHNMDAGRIFA